MAKTTINGVDLETVALADGGLAGGMFVTDPLVPTRQLLINAAREAAVHDADLLAALLDASAISLTRQTQDNGATNIILAALGVQVTSASEQILTFQSMVGFGTPTTSLSQYQGTAGKVTRYSMIKAWIRNNGSGTAQTAANVQIGLRVNNAGPAVIGSSLVDAVPVAGASAAISTVTFGQHSVFNFPDGGLIVPGGYGLTITAEIPQWNTSTANPKVYVMLFGKEYTA